ncbi:MAG: hypothetical protein IIA55_10775 [Gemmatimonadetes bacterium]|nr:hypothetical protein [Gemmatimonadota bacterium]
MIAEKVLGAYATIGTMSPTELPPSEQAVWYRRAAEQDDKADADEDQPDIFTISHWNLFCRWFSLSGNHTQYPVFRKVQRRVQESPGTGVPGLCGLGTCACAQRVSVSAAS